MLLLTDGRVLINEMSRGRATNHWWTLSPDSSGNYQNGALSQVADSNAAHLFFNSAVFADGRVIVCGGVNASGALFNETEIYDPVTNQWTEAAAPPYDRVGGFTPCVTLRDGRFLVADFDGKRTAIYDPVTGLWRRSGQKLNADSIKEAWTLLPDGTVLSWDSKGHPKSQRYLPSFDLWIRCPDLPVDLIPQGGSATGSGIVLPNGKVFCMGGPPVSAIYTPPAILTGSGSWAVGPSPAPIGGQMVGQEEGPSAILPNGNVLVSVAPVAPVGNFFGSPTYFYEFDGASLVRAPDLPDNTVQAAKGRMVVLPTGEILYTTTDDSLFFYTNLPAPQTAFQPTITDFPVLVERGGNYSLKGMQLNGVSNGSSMGDPHGNTTNYPLVRLTEPTGAVGYLRTFGHSTMGLQTGSAIVSTNVAISPDLSLGPKQIQAVANGVASDPVATAVVAAIPVGTLSVAIGSVVSGGVDQLSLSDDSYLALTPTRGLLRATFEAVLPSPGSPSALGVGLEDRTSIDGVRRTLELFNWETQAYEVLETTTASTTDLASALALAGNLGRYVGPDGQVAGRLTYQKQDRSGFTASIDRLVVLSAP